MHPVLFEIPWFNGPIKYHAYGFFLAVAFLVGMALAVRESKKQGINGNDVVSVCFLGIVTSLIGARLLHLMMAEPRAFFQDPTIFFQFARGGYAFYGGFILALVSTMVFCRIKGIRFLQLADNMTLGMSLGLAFGRTGCLLAGCCHGRPIDQPLPDWALSVIPLRWPELFAITFPVGAGGQGGFLGQPVVPTQPLSGLYCVAIFLLLALWIAPRKRYHGQIFVWYCILYAIARSTIELFRGDDRGMYFGDALSTSQLVSVPVVLVGIGILVWARRRPGRTE